MKCGSIVCLSLAALLANGALRADVVVSPPTVNLDSPEATQQLLVTVTGPDGQPADRTRAATYQSSSSDLVTVDATGLLTPRAEGRTEVVVRVGAEVVRVPVVVTGLKQPAPVSFEHDIIPILTKATCNCRRLPRQGRGAERLQADGLRLRPPGGLSEPW